MEKGKKNNQYFGFSSKLIKLRVLLMILPPPFPFCVCVLCELCVLCVLYVLCTIVLCKFDVPGWACSPLWRDSSRGPGWPSPSHRSWTGQVRPGSLAPGTYNVYYVYYVYYVLYVNYVYCALCAHWVICILFCVIGVCITICTIKAGPAWFLAPVPIMYYYYYYYYYVQ